MSRRRRTCSVAAAGLLLALSGTGPSAAQEVPALELLTGTVVVRDVGGGGAALSPDGTVVGFATSDALVPEDVNGSRDSYLRDVGGGPVRLASVAADGSPLSGDSYETVLSTGGRYVAFSSTADDAVPEDTNGTTDVFWRDTATGEVRRVSVASDGTQGDDMSSAPGLSSDGRYVTFESYASTLVPDDTNRTWDVFLHDTATATTERVTVGSAGEQGTLDCPH